VTQTASEAPLPGPAPEKKSILRTTLVVMPALLVFRVGEIFLPLLLAYWFGRTAAMDVYFFAWAVFAFAGSLVFSAFKDSPLVPVIAEERLARPKDVPPLLGSVLMHTWVVGGVLALAVGALTLT
jgi:putative peptidoglycan lipid II flippase